MKVGEAIWCTIGNFFEAMSDRARHLRCFFGSPATKVVLRICANMDKNETHSNFVGFGASCDTVRHYITFKLMKAVLHTFSARQFWKN